MLDFGRKTFVVFVLFLIPHLVLRREHLFESALASWTISVYVTSHHSNLYSRARNKNTENSIYLSIHTRSFLQACLHTPEPLCQNVACRRSSAIGSARLAICRGVRCSCDCAIQRRGQGYRGRSCSQAQEVAPHHRGDPGREDCRRCQNLGRVQVGLRARIGVRARRAYLPLARYRCRERLHSSDSRAGGFVHGQGSARQVRGDVCDECHRQGDAGGGHPAAFGHAVCHARRHKGLAKQGDGSESHGGCGQGRSRGMGRCRAR